MNKGIEILAIELNESAVKALFDELGVTPIVELHGAFIKYLAPNLCVYVGDFFALSATDIGQIDCVYDRAALVALPAELRLKYTQHLVRITHSCQQLLISYAYDQSLFAGPPFSVSAEEIAQHYAHTFHIKELHHDKVAGGFRNQNDVFESVYLLNEIQ